MFQVRSEVEAGEGRRGGAKILLQIRVKNGLIWFIVKETDLRPQISFSVCSVTWQAFWFFPSSFV